MNYKKTTFPNGLRVISEKIPYVKSFSLGFWFNVGSRDEEITNNGITHFIEHMLFKGTKNRTAKKISDDIEGYGGYLNAFTSKEHTCYYGRGLEEHLERTFSVISDMVQNPLFKDKEIKKEANVIVDELYDIEDNPEELIFDKFEESVYLRDPLGLAIIGTEENIRSFDSHALFEYIGGKYGFNNMIISAAGAVEHDELLRLVEKYINVSFETKPERSKLFTGFNKESLFFQKEIQQVHLIIGKTTYGFKDKKRIAVNILSHILGEGSSSRLFQNVREKKGIAYQLNSFLNSFYDVSSFGVYLSTNEKKAGLAQTLVFNEFKSLREKAVTLKELNRAKEYIKGNMLLGLESMTNRMFRLSNTELYYGRFVSPEEVIQMINEITPKEILELSNEILVEDELTTVLIGAKNYINNKAA